MGHIVTRVGLAYVSIFLSIAVVMSACASETSDDVPVTGTGDRGTAGSDMDGDGDSDGDTDGDGDADSEETCAEVSETAIAEKAPADIVFVVDNSGSMTAEANMVQNNMNKFSSQIVNSGVDAHVVLITAPSIGLGSIGAGGNGICIKAPLGSGNCPLDSNLPEYRHVPSTIGSTDALLQIKATYSTWKQSLRPGAALHFVAVSDDNSLLMPAATFTQSMAASNPPITDFTFHAIVSPVGPIEACIPPDMHCCNLTASEGNVYKKLVNQTGGVLGDLCKQEFGPIFDELATQISQIAIACQWEIPEPPEGEELDPKKVNVDFVDDQGQTHQIGYIDSKNECGNVENAWYYDDPADPSKIYVCSQTCDWMHDQEKAEIVIKFGCETLPATVV